MCPTPLGYIEGFAPGVYPGKDDSGWRAECTKGFVAVFRGFEVSLAARARDVGADEGVVDDSAVAGSKFNGFDFPVFCEVGRDDEDLVLVLIVAADGKGFCHGEYEVGGAEYRACWKFRHGGFKGDIALGKAGVDPVCDGVDFCFGECSRADVLAVVVIGFPRGHVLGFCDVFDHVCICRDFAVICEGHRPYFTVSMTRCAVVVYD